MKTFKEWSQELRPPPPPPMRRSEIFDKAMEIATVFIDKLQPTLRDLANIKDRNLRNAVKTILLSKIKDSMRKYF